jgi:hypothetical protein
VSEQPDWSKFPDSMLVAVAGEMALERKHSEEFAEALRAIGFPETLAAVREGRVRPFMEAVEEEWANLSAEGEQG